MRLLSSRWCVATASLALAAGLLGLTTPTYAAGKPDLTVSGVSAPLPKANKGGALKVRYTLNNGGSSAAGSSTTKLWLSKDKKLGSSDRLLGSKSQKSVSGGGSWNGTVKGKVPAATKIGLYWVLVCADSTKRVAESAEGNNCSVSSEQVDVRAVGTPFAVPDFVTSPEDFEEIVTESFLLDNDYDPAGESVTVENVFSPVEPGLSLTWESGALSLVPDANVTGVFHIAYIIRNESGRTDQSVLTITFENTNDAPVAQDDMGMTNYNQLLTMAVTDLSGNDTDVDLDALTVTAVGSPVNGLVVLSGSQVFFTPTTNFYGPAGFEYTISDGQITDTGYVNVTVLPPV